MWFIATLGSNPSATAMTGGARCRGGKSRHRASSLAAAASAGVQAAPSADRQEGATGAAAAADDPGSRSGQRLPVTRFSNLGAAALGVAAVLLASGLAIIVRMRRRSG